MNTEILFSEVGTLGCATLNRPAAFNALTHNMCVLLSKQLEAWEQDKNITAVLIRSTHEKAFCAGGDIRRIYDSGLAKDDYALRFFKDEYHLNQQIKNYKKPYIALLDGITMGGGVGISVHGSHRIVTEKTTFAMPETGIGFFPDVGGSYFLPRCPGYIGTYLALTGARLKAADCLYACIATHFMSSAKMEAFIDRLRQTTVEVALSEFASDPGPASLSQFRSDIDHCFNKNSVEEIFAALQALNTDWALSTLKQLQQSSPTSLKVTLKALQLGQDLDLNPCLAMEYKIAQGFMQHPDFFEGVRARIVDKDQAPVWQPAQLETVTDTMIATFFKEGCTV